MKMNKITRGISIAIGLFISLSSFAQTEVNAADLTTDWQKMQEENGVQFFVREQACDMPVSKNDLIYAFGNLLNTTNEPKTVQFQLAVQYDDRCNGCEANVESVKTVTIPANSSLVCDCSFENTELHMLIKNLNHSDPSIFESLKLIQFKVD